MSAFPFHPENEYTTKLMEENRSYINRWLQENESKQAKLRERMSAYTHLSHMFQVHDLPLYHSHHEKLTKECDILKRQNEELQGRRAGLVASPSFYPPIIPGHKSPSYVAGHKKGQEESVAAAIQGYLAMARLGKLL